MNAHIFCLVWIPALASCAGSPHPDAPPPLTSNESNEDRAPANPRVPARSFGTASQAEKWWSEPSTACPAGTSLAGAAPPDGSQVGCKTDKGVNSGRMTRFYANGTKSEEGEYHKHRAQGVVTTWDAGGRKLKETPYEDGAKHGVETEWSVDGSVRAQRAYRRGKRNGPTRVWHPRGRQGLERPYVEGKLHGIETQWDASGRVLKLLEWEHDRLVKTVLYRHGKPIR